MNLSPVLGSALAFLVGATFHTAVASQSVPVPVLFSPKIVQSSIVPTGIEARMRFHLSQYDSSLSGRFNEGIVGPTADVSNDQATLLNTVYDFRLDFEAATGGMTWTISGGALPSPVVLNDVEIDAFNAIRFNARSLNGPKESHSLTFSDLVFDFRDQELLATGTLRTSGSVVNSTDSQRIVAGPGYLLSDYNWWLSGKLSTDGTYRSNTKIWIASHLLELAPGYVPPVPSATASALREPIAVPQVPEVSTFAMSVLGLFALLAVARRPRLVSPAAGSLPAVDP